MINIFKQFKKKNTLFFIISIFLSSCESVISAFQPFLLSIMTGLFQDLQNLKKPEQISNKDFWSLFIQLNNYESINDIIVTCGGILIGIIIFSTALAFFLRITSRFFHIKSAIDIVQRLRNELFWKLQWIKDDEFNKLSVSSIVSRATNDSYQFQETVLIVFMFFFESLLLIIGSLIFCVVLNWMLSSIFLVIIPLVLVVNFICNKKAKKYYSQNLEELDSVNRVMRENIAGTKTVRSFRLQKFQLERFDIHNLTWYKSIYKGEFTIYFGIIFLFYILNVAIILVLFISGTLNNFSVLGQKIDVSQVIAFANYLIYAVFCAFGISNALVSINRTKPCIERINEILNKNSENAEGKDFKEPFTPSIEFKNVSYSYGTSEDKKPIIDKISFKVNPGEIVGIIGPTGSGKSTIVLLASNLAEPEKGEIIFSNQTSSEVSSINIRKQISVAFQEKFIFSGTIKSNILMGNKSASDEKIKWAAKLACADEFIERSENKYDSYVLQNGNNFSGGQKQRLSIARTFTKDAGIYILDDSLSALDNLTRDKVLKNIKNNFKGKTFIIVSQQVKTIKDADKIIVLDKGKIIDIGTHSQLVKKCSLYNKIYDSQKTIGE